MFDFPVYLKFLFYDSIWTFSPTTTFLGSYHYANYCMIIKHGAYATLLKQHKYKYICMFPHT